MTYKYVFQSIEKPSNKLTFYKTNMLEALESILKTGTLPSVYRLVFTNDDIARIIYMRRL